ncbi:HEAT repeat domain-containing protein [Bacteroidota bacterium]
MKTYSKFFILLSTLLVLCFNNTLSQDTLKTGKRVTADMIIDNLLEGIKSENEGLKVSSSYYLGEREADKALIPLMSILHNDKLEEARIMAALSLFKIGDERGLFAVKNAAEEDQSQIVRRMCAIFYRMHLEREKKKE